MIVLTKKQNDIFLEFKKPYLENMLANGIDVIPVAIKNDLYILPEAVLDDERLSELKQALINEDMLSKVEIREVKEDEFLNTEI